MEVILTRNSCQVARVELNAEEHAVIGRADFVRKRKMEDADVRLPRRLMELYYSDIVLMAKNIHERAKLVIKTGTFVTELNPGEETPVSNGSFICHRYLSDEYNMKISYTMKDATRCETEQSGSDTDDGESPPMYEEGQSQEYMLPTQLSQ